MHKAGCALVERIFKMTPTSPERRTTTADFKMIYTSADCIMTMTVSTKFVHISFITTTSIFGSKRRPCTSADLRMTLKLFKKEGYYCTTAVSKYLV
jgi:hypothetical protein